MAGDVDRGVTVTIKAPGRDQPRIMFHGSVNTVYDDIVTAFNMELELGETDNIPLADMVHMAQQAFNAVGTMAQQFDARPIGAGKKEQEGPAPDRGDPVKEDPVSVLLEEIENAPSAQFLKQLWVEYRELFTKHNSVQEAWSAKGKSLTGAA